MKRKNVTDESLTLRSVLVAGWLLPDDSFYWKLVDLALDYDKFPNNFDHPASETIDCKSFYQAVCKWGFEVLYE